MNYEERQKAKQQRLFERAGKADARADASQSSAGRISDGIPMGQPVLVGHHSEKRHRRDLDRMDSGYRKAKEERDKADRLRQRAEGLGKSGISSDDPEAVTKLRGKLAELESERDALKEINKVYRSAGCGEAGWKAVANLIGEKRTSVFLRPWVELSKDQPVPAYRLQNLGANIRRIKERIAALATESKKPEADSRRGKEIDVEERKDINRITVEFHEKPAKEMCKTMREMGFKWSPMESAWLRHLNNSGRAAVDRVWNLIEEQTAE